MILVFGSINADLVFAVDRLPARGETVLCAGYTVLPGGKGANQAAAAALAGAPVRMVGRVGRDPLGEPAVEALRQAGVEIDGIGRCDAVTGTAVIGVEAGGENQIIVASGANRHVGADQVPDELLRPGTVLVSQMEVPIPEIETLLLRARRRGCRTLLNLAPAAPIAEAALRAVDLLVVNEGEAAALAGRSAAPAEQARTLARRTGGAGIVTLGAAGAVFAADGETWQIGALAIDPLDTVGAGDAFVGVLSAGLDDGLDLPAAIHRASAAAGLACLGRGARGGLPDAASIAAALARLAPPVRLR